MIKTLKKEWNINVLVACEESQAVCIELRKKGIQAFSCDVIPSSGGYPEYHIQNDVLPLLKGKCTFTTCDGVEHHIPNKWDMIVAFPPCTDLCVSGARHFEKKRGNGVQEQSIEFFMNFLNAECDKIAIENPVGIISGSYIKEWFPHLIDKYNLPAPYSQSVQPYYFGDPYRKKTCLWLKSLPLLRPTNMVEVCDIREFTKIDGTVTTYSDWYNKGGKERPKLRAKTFKGLARAIASQWGTLLIKEYLERKDFMSKKSKVKVPSVSELALSLQQDYERWKEIYEHGSTDPNWGDGINLYLKRNHIINGKRACEEVLQDNYSDYPDIYYYPLPMEVSMEFMAVTRNISRYGGEIKGNKTIPYSKALPFEWGEEFK